jgi:hypothetical protein
VQHHAEQLPRSRSRDKANLIGALLDGDGGHRGNRTGQLPAGNGRRFVRVPGATDVTVISVSEASRIRPRPCRLEKGGGGTRGHDESVPAAGG